jgi:hypothetical protein
MTTTATDEQPPEPDDVDALDAAYRKAYEHATRAIDDALRGVADRVVERLTAPAWQPAEPLPDLAGTWNSMRHAVDLGPGTYSAEGWHAQCERAVRVAAEMEAQRQRLVEERSTAIAEEHAESERWNRLVTDLRDRLDSATANVTIARQQAIDAEVRLAEVQARLDLYVSGPIGKVLEAVWDDAAEATAEWTANNPGPGGVPHDPPRNPFRGD